jgi:hypothetical protein
MSAKTKQKVRTRTIQFQNIDRSKIFSSSAKFLSHLYFIGHEISFHNLKKKYLRNRDTGSFNYGGEYWVFVRIHRNKNPYIKPTQEADLSPKVKRIIIPRPEDHTSLVPKTHTVIYDLNPNHKLELTFSQNNILLHTKSVSC